MSGSEKDAGFCSGGDEDDMLGLHSPSASEDSIEVQVTPISLKNKRKLAEPRKIQDQCTAPLKKRRRYEIIEDTVSVGDEESRPASLSSPFRPWSTTSTSSKSNETKVPIKPVETTSSNSPKKLAKEEDEKLQRRLEENQRRHEAKIQEEVLLRLQESNRRPSSPLRQQRREPAQHQRFEPPLPPPPAPVILPHPRLQEEPLSLVLRGEVPRVPAHPAVSCGPFERPSSHGLEHMLTSNHHHPSSNHDSQSTSGHSRHGHAGGQQRNYKNMTRERRIEANARERTRVHTISAAFDTLRRAIPSYSHNQKLSKLSVLRIACSYIATLHKIATTPDGQAEVGPELGDCVDLVSRTIQTEGKLRKKKDE